MTARARKSYVAAPDSITSDGGRRDDPGSARQPR
jgi:hypothetical protein